MEGSGAGSGSVIFCTNWILEARTLADTNPDPDHLFFVVSQKNPDFNPIIMCGRSYPCLCADSVDSIGASGVPGGGQGSLLQATPHPPPESPG